MAGCLYSFLFQGEEERRNSEPQLQIHFLLSYQYMKGYLPICLQILILLKSYWPSGEKLFRFSFLLSLLVNFNFLKMFVCSWLNHVSPHWGKPSALLSLQLICQCLLDTSPSHTQKEYFMSYAGILWPSQVHT